MAAALPGALLRQVPRFPTALFATIEDLVLDESVFCYFRIFGWWLLVQSWRTLRFSDHGETHIELDEQGFTAKLTHSKTRLGLQCEYASCGYQPSMCYQAGRLDGLRLVTLKTRGSVRT